MRHECLPKMLISLRIRKKKENDFLGNGVACEEMLRSF